MPPSGFNKVQAKKVSSFLKLCLQDLIKETKKFNLTYVEALTNEINNIDLINSDDKSESNSYHLLIIIRSFYSDLLKLKPKSELEMLEFGKDIYKKIKSDILDIHVPKIG